MRVALFRLCGAVALLSAGFVMGRLAPEPVVEAQAPRVFEMRTYTTNPGMLPALETRFRDHTLKFFEKYNMKNIGYWIPTEGPMADTQLIYILSHQSREAAAKSWSGFQNDAEWKKVSSAGGGAMSSKVESMFLEPTDYSPMK